MKVLIVDDEPLVRRSLSRAFNAKGHHVCEASDGREGLLKWEIESPDVAFVDVLMPELSGPELLRSLSPELRLQTKVILMSAFTGEEGRISVEMAGADAFIPKPFEDIFQLVAIAEEILNHE
jgi:DNA-binding response OmpR family regulator